MSGFAHIPDKALRGREGRDMTQTGHSGTGARHSPRAADRNAWRTAFSGPSLTEGTSNGECRMRHNWLFVFFASTLLVGLVGCATPRSFTVSCSLMGASSIAEPGQRIDLGDFSVAAPKADGWCLGPRSSGGITFPTHPLMGQYIEKPERSMGRNTVFLGAQKWSLGATNLDSAGGFQQFAQEWVKRGMRIINFNSPEPTVSDVHNPRFTTLSAEIDVESSMNFDCVRYKLVAEERDNPVAPNIVFLSKTYGVICHHPTAPDYIVALALSERYERGKQIDPSLFDRLENQDAKPFFKSLEFAKAD